MASRFWVGSTGTWDATTTHWSATSGGTAGATAPTAADDVFFNASSGVGTVTLSNNINCRSLNCTGYTGTISHPISVNINIGDATAGAGNIALLFVTGMTYTSGGTSTSGFTFKSTSATQQTVNFANKTILACTFNGVGGSWYLASSMTMAALGIFNLTAGTVNMNNFAHTWGSLSCSGTIARTLTLGSSVITMIGASWDMSTSTNLTFNAGTSTIGWTSSTSVTPALNAPGQTFYDVLITKSSGGCSLNGSGVMTFHNFTMDNTILGGGNRAINVSATGGIVINGVFKYYGASATNPGLLFSGATTAARTVDLGTTGTVDFNSVDFRDIAVTGSAAPITGTRYGDGGGNSGISFPASKTMYWIAGTSNVTNVAAWSLTSGGTSAGEMPLLHDTAVFDANSFSTSGIVVTMGALRFPNMDASAATNNPTFRFTNPSGAGNSHYGGIVFPAAGCTIDAVGAAGSATSIVFFGRGSYALNFNGATIGATIGVQLNGGGTYTLGSHLVMAAANAFSVGAGTFDANGYDVTVGTFSGSGTLARSILMGSGTWTMTGTGNVWLFTVMTGLTLTPGTSTLVIGDTSASTKTISHGGTMTLNNLSIAGGTAAVIFGANPLILHDLSVAAPALLSFTPGSGSTVTVNGTVNMVGSAGNLITLQSGTSGSQFFLSKPSGTVAADYLSLKDSAAAGTAAWYAGTNSTDVSNNTGWQFTAPPITGGNIKVYSGSAFGAKPVKVWNGSAWVAKPLKVYNGTTWVKTNY